jgi:hypothetical protein
VKKDQINAVSKATSSKPCGYVDRRELFKIIMKGGEKTGLSLHLKTVMVHASFRKSTWSAKA